MHVGEGSGPIYEGEDSLLLYTFRTRQRIYCSFKYKSRKKGNSETYTKEHSAEYQSQALIDLARSLNKKIKDKSQILK